ncbi:MAG: ribonuclease [Clostridia bacterium]|nr:ribonuclease [Clostridia bacterium]
MKPWLILVVALLLFAGQQLGLLSDVTFDAAAPTQTPQVQSQLGSSAEEGGSAADALEAEGPIIAPQDIADYIFAYGTLPGNFITKSEAEALGWDSSENYLSDVAPGKSIGGDRFGNYEGLLPKASGRTWKEADCNYVSGPRNAERIVFSNDGLVYYTSDHYESFTQMEPSR